MILKFSGKRENEKANVVSTMINYIFKFDMNLKIFTKIHFLALIWKLYWKKESQLKLSACLFGLASKMYKIQSYLQRII